MWRIERDIEKRSLDEFSVFLSPCKTCKSPFLAEIATTVFYYDSSIASSFHIAYFIPYNSRTEYWTVAITTRIRSN